MVKLPETDAVLKCAERVLDDTREIGQFLSFCYVVVP